MKNIINEKPQKDLAGRLKTAVDFVSPVDIQNKVILDIGCGYGWFELDALKKSPKEIYSCEVSEVDLETIKNNVSAPNLFIKVSDATKLQFQDNYFDTVVCWEVIEHIPANTEDLMFSEVNRVLHDGGVFYLSTPFDSFLSKVCDPAWWLLGHRHYSVKALSDFATKHGFKVESVNIYGRFWLLADILNMYISKWIFRRTRFFKDTIDTHVNQEYSENNGFVNIFVKFRKVSNA